MPAPPDPSHSTSDREHPRRPGGGGEGRRTDGLSGAAAAGADRFWQEFSRARTERPRRGQAAADEAPPQPTDEKSEGHECLEWCPICRSADVVRAAGGPEVRNQIASLQRDSLLALRTLIDAYLARSGPSAPPMWAPPPQGYEPQPGYGPQPGDEPAPGTPPRRPSGPAEPPVQDIPID